MAVDTASDVSRSLPALVASLGGDPFYRAITIDFASDEARRRTALSEYFRCSLDEAALIGQRVFADPPEWGATAWHLPVADKVQAPAHADKVRRLRTILGPMGWTNYQRIIDFMGPRADRAVPRGCWYLSIVGVSPAHQGRGIGALLLAPTLRQASAQHAPCFLETFSPRNVAFYERLGFRTVVRHHEPTTGHEYLVMLRDTLA
jgi:GNAT superfamily N-acetyltransferase